MSKIVGVKLFRDICCLRRGLYLWKVRTMQNKYFAKVVVPKCLACYASNWFPPCHEQDLECCQAGF